MKRIVLLLLLILAFVFPFSACEKSAEQPAETSVTQGETTTQTPTPKVRLGVSSSIVVNESNYKKMMEEKYSDEAYGIYVSDLDADSPLKGTGFRRGDIIHAVGGKKVTSFAEIKTALCAFEPGDSTTVDVFRANFLSKEYSSFTVTVTFPKEEATAEDTSALAETTSEGSVTAETAFVSETAGSQAQ